MDIMIIADDLTGANDTNVQFAKVGAKAVTCYNLKSMALYQTFDVCSFSTESRNLQPDKVYRTVASVIRELPFGPDRFFYKKIDSALRGYFGIEIDALMDQMTAAKALLVAPAYPDNYRTTINGCQFVKGVAVDQTEMAADPIAPVRDSNLLTILGSQSRRKIGYLPLEQVENGYGAVQTYLQHLMDDHCQIIVADARTHEDLSTLAKVIWNEKAVIPCGSAGLALAMAGIYQQHQLKDCKPTTVMNPSPFLAVVGSKSEMAHLQVGAVQREFPNLKLLPIDAADLVDLRESETRIKKIAALASEIIKTAPSLVLYLSSAMIYKSSDAPLIASGLARICRGILEQTPVKTMFATGGDIAAHIFEELGIQALEVEKELEPGICKGKFLGGTYDGLSVITKAGSFGDELTLARIVKNVR